MGSVRLSGEDDSQPSTSDGKKYKISQKLLHDCGAVNYASVPRKLRSAIKKRSRESIILPLAISRKQRRISNGVEKFRENGAKKSKLIMKQGHITKDEEEVAETLNALADMFSDTAKTDKSVLDGEPSKIKSSTLVEAGSSITADTVILKVQEDSRKINTEVTLEAPSHSSEKVKNFESLDDAEQPESEFSKQSATLSVSGVQSYLSLGPRPKMFGPVIQSCESMMILDQVSASEIQRGKYHYTKEGKQKSLLMSRNFSTGVLSSETQGSCLGSSTSWSENTYCATMPSLTKNGFTADRIHLPEVLLEPKKLWKRCLAHVCIARLIKVLQKSETSKGLLLKPAQLTNGGDVQQGLHASINQKRGVNGGHGVLPFNGFTHPAFEKVFADAAIANLSHKSIHQDHQQASKASVICYSMEQGSDFLSLAAGGYSSDTKEGINRAGYSLEALKQFHAPYQHPQNHSAMHSSLPQNGYSSSFNGHTLAEVASQVQHPPYYNNTDGSSITAPLGHKLESQQQKWTAQVQAQYNPSGVAKQHFSNWQNGGRDSASVLSYAQALYPHLHSALGSKYQHFSSPQRQLMPSVNSSLALSDAERHHRRLNPPFERNGATLYSGSIQQMQLLCNQHL